MKNLKTLTRSISIAVFSALAFSVFVACSEEEPEVTPDDPGAFLRDFEWDYVDTEIALKDGTSLPFPSDRSLLEKIRYGEGGAPPTGDALVGSQVIFDVGGEVLVKPTGLTEYEYFGTDYSVVDDAILRASIRKSIWFKYEYFYNEGDGSLFITPEPEAAAAVTGLINDLYARILFSGSLDSLAAKVTEALFEDPRVAEAIASFLYDGIRGKLEEIPPQDPAELANIIAGALVDRLGEADLEDELEAALASRLEALTDLDPEATAEAMAAEIVLRVNAIFTEENISKAILPFLEELDGRDPAEVSANLAQAVYNVAATLLTEERLSGIVESVWQDFVDVPTEELGDISTELAMLIIDNWLNSETLSAAVLPYTTLIEATAPEDIQALADAAVNHLIATVDALNARFPDLNLSPPWAAIRVAVRQAFAAAKPIIDTEGAQAVADNIGEMLAAQFFTQEKIEGAVLSALLRLQGVPPQVAGDTIGAWLIEVIDAAEDAVVDSLAARLEIKVGEFEAQEAADTLAALLSAKITSALSEEAVYDFLLPLLEQLTQIDPEASAAFLTDLIIQSELVPPELVEEKLAEVIESILVELLPVDKDKLAERLVTAILESDLVTGIEPERVEKVLQFLLYRRVIERAQSVSAIERIEIELARPN